MILKNEEKWDNMLKDMNTNSITSSLLPIAPPIVCAVTFIENKLLYKAKQIVEQSNLERKIKYILNDEEEFILLKIEDVEEYKEYIKNSLISVKPMSAPTNQLFYIDYVYTSNTNLKD